MRKYVVISAFLYFGVLGTDYTDCGSRYVIKSVKLDGCDGSNCIIPTGTNKSMSLHIHSGFKAEKVTSDIYVTIVSNKFKLNVVPTDPCEVLSCPVQTDNDLFYNVSFYVGHELSWYDKVPLTVKLEDMANNASTQIVCVSVNVEIKDEN